MSDVAVEIRGLRKDFTVYGNHSSKFLFGRKMTQKRTVLDGIDITVKKGEIVGLLGRNGSGKSTLLKIVSGILAPTSGSVSVDGKVSSILELNMGFHDDLTGIENIYIRSKMYGIEKRTVDERLQDIVDYADIGEFVYSPVRMLSSGMRARLAFAIMVNVDADIYIIDEALSVGDSRFNNKTAGYLKTLVQKGKTVILTAHSSGNIRRICSRAVILEGGKITMDGNPEEVCACYDAMGLHSDDAVSELAKAGMPAAEYRMSLISKRDGDTDSSLSWLVKAAMSGHSVAMSDYGDILLSKGKKEEAEFYYRMASDADNGSARWKYAVMQSGFGEDRLIETMRWMAYNGDHFDKLRYGEMLFLTATSESDYEKAFSVFTESFEKGNVEAGHHMARMMLNGKGTDISADKAISLLEDLAGRGHIKSMAELLKMYSDGRYAPVDMAKVFGYTVALANAGLPEYQFKAAMMLKDGIGTDKDEDGARKWFGKYAISSIGNVVHDASVSSRFFRHKPDLDAYEINEILIKGNNRKALAENLESLMDSQKIKEPGKIFELSSVAANTMGYSQLFLADCYYKGIGVEPDMAKAFSLYKTVADLGSSRGMLMTALMYRDGVGTERDMKAFDRYIRMSAKKDNTVAVEIVMQIDKENAKRLKKIANPNKFSRSSIK